MSMTVVLARPHTFIATEMRPLLEGLGYQTKKPELLADLDSIGRGAAGAVVSLAISSPIGETAEAGSPKDLKPGLDVQLIERTVAQAVEHLSATDLVATSEPGAIPEGPR